MDIFPSSGYNKKKPVQQSSLAQQNAALLLANRGIGANTSTTTTSTTNTTTTTLNQHQSLLQQHSRLNIDQAELDRENERLKEEQILKASMAKASMMSREEAAGKAIQVPYEPIVTGWDPPSCIRALSPKQIQQIRTNHNIAILGKDVPPPLETFKLMRIPQPIINCLQSQGIMAPKPIQMQGITAALSGRDMIGIAQTGGGKTLVFALPLVVLALREEIRQPYRKREGPFGLVLVPQRELAEQIHQFVDNICTYVQKSGLALLTSLLAIGGASMADQWSKLEPNRGFHILVGTPGRVKGLIADNKINLERCKLFCMDEADRLVSDSFQSDLQTILGGFTKSKQTILFSATMPASVKILVTQALHNPVTVTVGQAGTANKDITQEVFWHSENEKLHAMLKAITRTPPPALIFCNSQTTVDLVYEYCRIKGIDAGCIHSGIDQTNRSKTIDEFKNGVLDVLVATDLLAKGIDFGTTKHIEHVINFDMPDEIQFYVHRIGRTGRAGRKGIATTFVNEKTKDQILLDLKHLLRDAEQIIPQELLSIDDPYEQMQKEGLMGETQKGLLCQHCGGMGHSVQYCPTLMKKQGPSRRGRIDTVDYNDRH